jgi:hypothetical protein
MRKNPIAAVPVLTQPRPCLPRHLTAAIVKLKLDPQTGASVEVSLADKRQNAGAATPLRSLPGGAVERHELSLEELVLGSMRGPAMPALPAASPAEPYDPNGDALHQLADVVDAEAKHGRAIVAGFAADAVSCATEFAIGDEFDAVEQGAHIWSVAAWSCPSGGGSFSLTYQLSNFLSANAVTTQDFGTLTYGSDCTRVVIAVGAYVGTSASATAVPVNGVSASAVAGTLSNGAAGNMFTQIWETNSALSGSSGDVQVTYSASSQTVGNVFNGVALYCLTTTTPTAHNGEVASNIFGATVNQNVSVPTGRVAIGIVNGPSSAFASGGTWTNLSQDAYNSSGTSIVTGHTASAGTVSVTATGTGTSGMELSLASGGP